MKTKLETYFLPVIDSVDTNIDLNDRKISLTIEDLYKHWFKWFYPIIRNYYQKLAYIKIKNTTAFFIELYILLKYFFISKWLLLKRLVRIEKPEEYTGFQKDIILSY